MTLPATPSRLPHRFLIAHRAGNDLERLRAAEQLGARLVEADLRLFRGRVDVRHLKSVGPLPLYWDCWFLARPFARHLRLEELLDALGPETELMLDLKGWNRALSHKLRAALEARPHVGSITVCARNWRLLEPLEGLSGVRTVCSVGNVRGLKRLLAHARRRQRRVAGVSIHRRLLDPEVVLDLHLAAELVMTWPVNDVATAHELSSWGVHGFITDVPATLAGRMPLVRTKHGEAEVAAA